MNIRKTPTELVLRLLVGLVTVVLGTSPGHAREDGKPFVYGLQLGAPISTLDSLDAGNVNRLTVVSQIMEGLTGIDPKNDAEPVPRLAKSVHQVDPWTYVFRLRDGVYFHPHNHGLEQQETEKLTAGDVQFSLERASYLVRSIKSVEAINDDLVKIKLNEPDDDLLLILSTAPGYVTCKDYYESLGDNDDERRKAFQKAPIGTGPYRLAHSLDQGGNLIVLHRFANYRDRSWVALETAIKSIEFHDYKTSGDIVTGMSAGEIQMTHLMRSLWTPTKVLSEPDQASQSARVLELTPPFLRILAINVQKPHLTDPRIRLLLNLAVNMKETKGEPSPPTAKHPEGYRYYLEISRMFLKAKVRYDLSMMLQDVGIQEDLEALRKRGLELQYIDSEDPTRDRILDIIERGINKHLGIAVHREPVSRWEKPAWTEPQGYDFFYTAWAPSTHSQRDGPKILQSLFSSNSPDNLSYYSDSDDLFLYAEKMNPAAQGSLFENLRARVLADCPHIWIPGLATHALIYNNLYEFDVGNSLLIFFTSFLKDLRRKP